MPPKWYPKLIKHRPWQEFSFEVRCWMSRGRPKCTKKDLTYFGTSFINVFFVGQVFYRININVLPQREHHLRGGAILRVVGSTKTRPWRDRRMQSLKRWIIEKAWPREKFVDQIDFVTFEYCSVTWTMRTKKTHAWAIGSTVGKNHSFSTSAKLSFKRHALRHLRRPRGNKSDLKCMATLKLLHLIVDRCLTCFMYMWIECWNNTSKTSPWSSQKDV